MEMIIKTENKKDILQNFTKRLVYKACKLHGFNFFFKSWRMRLI